MLFKLAGAKRRGFTGSAYAYAARNRQGEVVFWGIRSCVASSATGAVHEALVECPRIILKFFLPFCHCSIVVCLV